MTLKCPKHWKPSFVLIFFGCPKFSFVACHGAVEHWWGRVFCVSFVRWMSAAKPEVWVWLFEVRLEMESVVQFPDDADSLSFMVKVNGIS